MTLTDLYTAHHDTLVAYAAKIIGDPIAAEDIVQDGFVAVYRKGYETVSENLLVMTIRNTAITYKGHQNHHYDIDGCWGIPDEPTPLKEVDTIRVKMIQRIIKEIDKLPAASRRIMKLRYLEGLSYEDIADRLSITRQSVRSLVSYATRKVRLRFEGYEL